MLIEFSVANYRSFRERQTLSMVASSRLGKRENVFKPSMVGEKLPALLKACVVYGPNASGKSNLLRALSVVSRIAARSPGEKSPLPVSPFRFDPKLLDRPSVFELHFVAKGKRYQFDLSATPERIVAERLIEYPGGEPDVLYERLYSSDGDAYTFSAMLEADEDLRQAWRKLTPPHSLFIAQAVANSSEGLNHQLRVPLEWLQEAIFDLLHGMKGMSGAALRLVAKGPTHSADIASFLQDVDVPVSRIRVEARPSATEVGIVENALAAGSTTARDKTTLTHTSALGEADMDYGEESEGTQNLIGFWLPWATRDTSIRGRCVLAVDEMDSSLHPQIVVALVKKHLASTNPTQLIFTTHDTHLMDAKVLRRDQFWITERDPNGATQLRSIHDFQGRDSEDIERRYFAGRYRGLPLVRTE